MTDDRQKRGTGGHPQQGQQGQFGQSPSLQPDRQQSQQGRMDETGSRQDIQGEGSGSNRQARQAHQDHMERLHSGQRSGGLDDMNEQLRQAGSAPKSPRQDHTRPYTPQQGEKPQGQQQQSHPHDVHADREQHMSGPNLGATPQMGQRSVISENPDRGAMAQTSLPQGTKSSRTWTQTSGGQQATQTSLEGGQWPPQQGQSGESDPQKQPGSTGGESPKRQR